eukprot:329520-Chlamydomonas_euryale.AAC.2
MPRYIPLFRRQCRIWPAVHPVLEPAAPVAHRPVGAAAAAITRTRAGCVLRHAYCAVERHHHDTGASNVGAP